MYYAAILNITPENLNLMSLVYCSQRRYKVDSQGLIAGAFARFRVLWILYTTLSSLLGIRIRITTIVTNTAVVLQPLYTSHTQRFPRHEPLK